VKIKDFDSIFLTTIADYWQICNVDLCGGKLVPKHQQNKTDTSRQALNGYASDTPAGDCC